MVLYPFEGKDICGGRYRALSIIRGKFFERKETVPALVYDFEREVFSAYNKIACRDRLLLYNFYDSKLNAVGVIRDSHKDAKVG